MKTLFVFAFAGLALLGLGLAPAGLAPLLAYAAAPHSAASLSASAPSAKESVPRRVEARPFWLCRQQRAEGLSARALWIHHFRKNHLRESEKCLTLYSERGRDKVIRVSSWLSACQKALQDKKQELERRLWRCEAQPRLQALYSPPLIQTAPPITPPPITAQPRPLSGQRASGEAAQRLAPRGRQALPLRRANGQP